MTETDDGKTATSTVDPKLSDETVSIYAINAGSGDAFYFHFKREVPQVEPSTGTLKLDNNGDPVYDVTDATMIVDG